MKRMIFVLALTLAAAATVTAGQKPGNGKPPKDAKHGKAAGNSAPVSATVHFSTGDAGVLHTYYGPRYKSLPPGLQKKLARGGQLPPGWQKKMQPFPIDLERRLAPLPTNYGRGVIDGNAVIYDQRSHVVIDVTILF
jgi:hypothetical protein